ncbi:MAG: hypothetical protein LUG86_09720 [Oscillospiraceae bacterium]|nr:hypothetical protein [Oscillospiraceae bacterium]
MERDSLKDLLYCLSRFGLFWAITVFGIIMGRTAVLGVVGTIIPRLQLYNNTELLSLISCIIPGVMLIMLFADDAKRHTAYRSYRPLFVTCVMLVTGIVYYIPAVVAGYLTEERAVDAITQLYFTSYWLSFVSERLEIYALLGTVFWVALCILTYIIARRVYLHKFESGEYEYEVDEF